MFETKRTLIVVYKDELIMNQLKKMVETCDDSEDSIVGTRDNSVNIVSWTEKVWLDNKKAGNLQGKILFLGDVKGTDKLVPVLDIKFNEHGVRFGYAGNQAVLFVDPKALTDRKLYDEFLKKLSEYPIPDVLKNLKESHGRENEADEKELKESQNLFQLMQKSFNTNIKPTPKMAEAQERIKQAFSNGAENMQKVGNQIVTRSEEIFRNKKLMARQMLFYGVIKLYEDELEGFMSL